MNKLVLSLLALIAILFIIAGYSGERAVFDNGGMKDLRDITQLNNSIKEGPVLVEIGGETCPACNTQEPVMEEIAKEYEGRAFVIFIDADLKNTRKIALSFNVYAVPDIFVIADNTDDGYVYMAENGETTTDRNEARFIGITPKENLTATLDYALAYRQ